MLSALHIENIAVIETLEVVFSRGFNVLTGETGAGKSIIIDAIGAILGERTSRDIIRTGASFASVTAQFTELSSDTQALLSEYGFSPDDDGSLIIRRDIYPDGRNTCRVNGAPVSVSQLKSAGRALVDIHGQHDGQKLLDEACHIGYLDRFCGNDTLRFAYGAEFERLRAIREEINGLLMDEKEKERKIEMLTFQISELRSASLREGEEEELQKRRELLKNAGRISEGLDRAYSFFYGDEEQAGVCASMKEAIGALLPIADMDERFKELSRKAEELMYRAIDATDELRALRGDIDSTPEELEAVEARLDLIYRLKRKYGASVSDMLSYLENAERELSSIVSAEETIGKLKERYTEVKARAQQCAEALRASRLDGASELSGRIVSELQSLDMKNARFPISVEAAKTEKGGIRLTPDGMDEVRFLISTNAGEDPKELSKIASGGELSRVMLALKNVLSETDPVDTMIFDEVDTGVSGRAAAKVAQKLKQVSKDKQVLCVTHLAQIAAFADSHFLIRKTERKDRTFTEVSELPLEERKRELARIIGGEVITETTLKSAEELIRASNA